MSLVLCLSHKCEPGLRGDNRANFSPGENFSLAKGVEILLRLHDEFQPGLKYCFPGNKITAHVKACFSARAEIPFDYMGFFLIFQPGLRILAWFFRLG